MPRRTSLAWPVVAVVATSALAQALGSGPDWQDPALALTLFLLLLMLPGWGWRWLLGSALALSVFIAMVAAFQIGILDRPRGPFASPNYAGGFAVLMFFLALSCRNWRTSPRRPAGAGRLVEDASAALKGRGATLAATANIITIALSQSRGAIGALGAGLFILLWRRLPILGIALAVFCALAVLAIRPGYHELRLDIWQTAWLVAEQRLLSGWGFGPPRFYNVPLEWLVWTGLPGLAAVAWLYFAALRRAWAQPALAAFLVAWLVQGLFLHLIAVTTIPFIAVVAYLCRPDCRRQARIIA